MNVGNRKGSESSSGSANSCASSLTPIYESSNYSCSNETLRETSVTLPIETIETIKLMNDESFIHYIRNNCDLIENIIYSMPKNSYKPGQIHPEEIFSIIMTETIDEDDEIDTTILRNYLINKK